MTDSVIPYIKEWKNRPLDKGDPVVFMDAIHYKAREDRQIKSKAAYMMVGVNLENFKYISLNLLALCF
nr:transposase [Gottschalkia acidurici]